VLVAAIDGIGHGPEAAEASRIAASTLETYAEQSLVSLFVKCHKALHDTRGVVMSVVAIDCISHRLTWLGVGNVEGRLLRFNNGSDRAEETLLLRSGVVGHDLPSTLTVSVLPISNGDLLLLATDGIHVDFTAGLHIGKSPHQIANDTLTHHSKGIDDALVVAVKYQGGGSRAS
jgi:serine phosphatase RsbU (regulator of sigma subunit)